MDQDTNIKIEQIIIICALIWASFHQTKIKIGGLQTEANDLSKGLTEI